MGIALKKPTVGVWVAPVVVEFQPGRGETVHGPEQALHYLLIRWPVQRGLRYEQACIVTAMCVEGHHGLSQAREAFIAAAVEANILSIMRTTGSLGTSSISSH
ncbi:MULTISPECIES: DUF982 domain-containing protein [unclassified Shinella]|uniref:DUF982 domain-containing protein n=1 Tax=unclassified Shinella TaxID=2643062 RepID=UPI00234E48C2|nr:MULTISPECIES: DUF982 domain-containing protein [unclassified Shinella]MCO5148476.1 DUF982 domain-containing protein [Shinella sp.]MDC7264549.1 DUF982 domain-containing protein [Shinella sp. HY16]MDC7271446.1 DUF982 domain-containing protein [Shinella sp. YZ44]